MLSFPLGGPEVFGPLLFVAGAVGGLISLAFLLGILIVEPLAFFILVAIASLVWQLAGRPWTRQGQGGRWAAGDEPLYEDDDDF